MELPVTELESPVDTALTDMRCLALDASGVSHPGRRRLNQDQFLIADLAVARRRTSSVSPRRWSRAASAAAGSRPEWLLVVADGMGGHPCGEVASLLAVRVLVKELLAGPAPAATGDLQRRLELALRCSDEAIHRAADRRADLAGMGTTMTAAWWIPPMLYFAHIGDSRLYLLRQGRLSRATTDHTLASNLAAVGAGAVRTAGLEHVLTQTVGGGDVGIDPDQGSRRLEPGDALLLCSDGLVRGVTDEEIERALTMAESARTAAVVLLGGALATDDGDNITAVVARVKPASRVPAVDPRFDRGREVR